MRRLHAHVAGEELRLLRQLLQLLDQHRALRQPQREARSHVFRVEREQAHLRADLAVVTLLGLLLLQDPLVEFLLVLEGRAVEALELRVLLVAAEVGAGDAQQLDAAGLHVAGAHDVRPGAKVHELAVLEEADGFALGDVGEALDLELLARALEVGQRLGAGLDALLEDLVLLGDLAHLLLDLGEVVGGEAVLQVEVVVEALVGGRADVEQGVRPETEDGGGEDVRAGMAEAHELVHLLALVERLALHVGLGGLEVSGLRLGFVVHGKGS